MTLSEPPRVGLALTSWKPEEVRRGIRKKELRYIVRLNPLSVNKVPEMQLWEHYHPVNLIDLRFPEDDLKSCLDD